MTTQKIAAHLISYGVILYRFYTGDSPDQVGTAAFWDQAVKELYQQNPFPDYWQGKVIRVFHGDCPELDRLTASKVVNLQDYRPDLPGCQPAEGLNTGRSMDLMLFPPNWTPDGVSPFPITQDEFNRTRRDMAHEEGHGYEFACQVLSGQLYVQKELKRLWRSLSPMHAEGGEGESFAEDFRALMGTQETLGSFSDGVRFYPSDRPALYVLMRAMYWMVKNLAGKILADIQAQPDRVTWREHKLNFIGPIFVGMEEVGFFSLDANRTLWKMKNNTWERV